MLLNGQSKSERDRCRLQQRSAAANGRRTREEPALGMWRQHVQCESMKIKIQRNLEVLVFPCLLKTISSSLACRSWS